jgi:hypothetical protein
MLRGYIPKEWTNVYRLISSNNARSDTTTRWSTTIGNCLWTYAFNMWDHRCKLLAEDEEGLQITKIDNAIRALYAEKDLFMNIDKGLFATPLARVLAKTTSMKEAHLLGLQAAKTCWESNTAPNEALENVINPTHHNAIEVKTKKEAKSPKRNNRKRTNADKKKQENANASNATKTTTRPNQHQSAHTT